MRMTGGVREEDRSDLLSAFQAPNPLGFALKSPKRGAFIGFEFGERTGSGKIEIGEGLNVGRMGE